MTTFVAVLIDGLIYSSWLFIMAIVALLGIFGLLLLWSMWRNRGRLWKRRNRR